MGSDQLDDQWSQTASCVPSSIRCYTPILSSLILQGSPGNLSLFLIYAIQLLARSFFFFQGQKYRFKVRICQKLSFKGHNFDKKFNKINKKFNKINFE